ncbi:RICIN domain-containing protein [Mycetohabitans endofungorum]|uniref:RICIN domain-containing protein n=1 Tax=Mycetohabitans endofungorum TaxID=417203 RepID=UPI0030CAAA0D
MHRITIVTMTFAATLGCVTCASAFETRESAYGLIESKYKQDAKQASCMRTFENSTSVRIGVCEAQGGPSDYTSMRQWRLVEQEDGTYLIQNKYRNDMGAGSCLQALPQSTDLIVGSCNGDTSAPLSTKQWRLEGDTFRLAKNLYKDSAPPSHNCARVYAGSNAEIQIGACDAQGGPSDYTSMRQWQFAMFPPPVTPGGMASLSYHIPTTPPITQITFPITVVRAPDAAGYYFAQQYGFSGGSVGYMGVRPRPGGKSLAAFSVFGSGTEVVDTTRCTGGADGGEGVSCSAEHELVHGRKYLLTITRDSADPRVWRGSITDSVTHQQVVLGAYKVPATWGSLFSSQSGFIEYYAKVSSCASIPLAEILFSPPYGSDGRAGSLYAQKEYGRCQGKMNYLHEVRGEDSYFRVGF